MAFRFCESICETYFLFEVLKMLAELYINGLLETYWPLAPLPPMAPLPHAAAWVFYLVIHKLRLVKVKLDEYLPNANTENRKCFVLYAKSVHVANFVNSSEKSN